VSSMRILTYNTQMRSALMEMGFPPSIPPVYTAPLRAKLISKGIVDSPLEIDVACLNEVFDEPARDVFSGELEADFPYQVAKADTFHTRIVSPGITDDIQEQVWELTFGPLTDLSGLAMAKFEDSGLFLASRIPFATVPTPLDVIDLLGPGAFPGGVPVVRFLMYADSSDNDKFAAKGVLYVRLKPPGLAPLHVFMSHTQADTDAIEENVGDRRKQIQNVADFVELCVGESPPFSEEVFFLGDLNIVGHGAMNADAHPVGPDPEWTNLFGKAGAPMFDQLVDRWGRDQCPGGTSGRTDPGITADAVYPPFRQRLDYCFSSASSQLSVQHLRVDRELADPQGLVPYLSDHQPLLADINRKLPNCNPATAMVTPDKVDFSHSGSLQEGTVRWYRFDRQGTYDVDLDVDGATTLYEIYLGDDFSTPQPPYREIFDPRRGTRFVLAAPFFIKVFLRKRHSESSYTLRTHRHDGRTLDDAIVLVPGVSRRDHFPKQQFNIDTAAADWDDSESKWFIVETPRIPVPHPIDLTVEVRDQTEDTGTGPEPTDVVVTLGKWDGNGPPASFMDQAGPSSAPVGLNWQAGDNDHFVVLVQRRTATNRLVEFEIEANTNLSLLLARPSVDTTLTCREELSGWGADDIALELRADGDLVADIPNSVIGDFEDDSIRDVGDKLDPIIPYVTGIEVKVIEEDDIDDDDIGAGTIPLARDATGAPGFTILQAGIDGHIRGSLEIAVDDGVYAFACVISRWYAAA
jgi:endonuclease/exonuclease/phosphatase family metal-dependent hydrolase